MSEHIRVQAEFYSSEEDGNRTPIFSYVGRVAHHFDSHSEAIGMGRAATAMDTTILGMRQEDHKILFQYRVRFLTYWRDTVDTYPCQLRPFLHAYCIGRDKLKILESSLSEMIVLQKEKETQAIERALAVKELRNLRARPWERGQPGKTKAPARQYLRTETTLEVPAFAIPTSENEDPIVNIEAEIKRLDEGTVAVDIRIRAILMAQDDALHRLQNEAHDVIDEAEGKAVVAFDLKFRGHNKLQTPTWERATVWERSEIARTGAAEAAQLRREQVEFMRRPVQVAYENREAPNTSAGTPIRSTDPEEGNGMPPLGSVPVPNLGVQAVGVIPMTSNNTPIVVMPGARMEGQGSRTSRVAASNEAIRKALRAARTPSEGIEMGKAVLGILREDLLNMPGRDILRRELYRIFIMWVHDNDQVTSDRMTQAQAELDRVQRQWEEQCPGLAEQAGGGLGPMDGARIRIHSGHQQDVVIDVAFRVHAMEDTPQLDLANLPPPTTTVTTPSPTTDLVPYNLPTIIEDLYEDTRGDMVRDQDNEVTEAQRH